MTISSSDRAAIIVRLKQLAHAVTLGPEAVAREYTMRVPAEPLRDADLVLSTAADLLSQPEPEGVTERIASIATAVRECAFGWEPTARLIGNVCAEDVADLCGAILARYARPTTEPVPGCSLVERRSWSIK
jgi:hypothetical protein